MKFRDGYWGIRAGFNHFSFQQVWETEVKDREGEKSLTIFSAVKPVKQRGDTLNFPLLTTVVSSPLPDVIRVRSWRHRGGLRRGPDFELIPDGAEQVRIEDGGEEAVFSAGALSLRVGKQGPWKASFVRRGEELTGIAGGLSGHFTDPAGQTFMAQYLGLSVGEAVYGLGERFTPLVKNGQTVDIWNEDGGTSSEQAYKNIPFYITSRGYGVLVNHPERVSFEAGSEVVSAVQFSVPGEFLDYYLIAGDSLKDVLRNYTALSGRPALPPAWSFGLWLTTSFTTSYDEKTVTGFIDGMAERKIPLSVFHFDCFWMKGFQWVDFEWDREQFPDPAAMLSRLKARGLKICLWINPYVAQKSALFDEGMEKGYLLKRPDGSVWQWDRWQAGMALVDFTNPAAVQWYRGRLKKLLDMGVDTFKTDFGERIPTEVVYHNGADPVKMHNYYTYLYNQAVFDLLRETRGEGEALVFARSATVGGQKFPVHWGGDCSANYGSMAETLRGGLSLALSGFGFWSHDISGFENTATADLFKRWIAFGLLSTHSRLHGSSSYRVPWNFDDEASDVTRFFTELKCRLMPYIYGQVLCACREGIPLMRAMILEFPEDPAVLYLDRQYMLGDSLLAAPVFSETGEVSYYLPPGRWINILTGEAVEGGGWKKERHDYFSLPLLARPGSVIPLGNNTQKPDYDYTDGVCLQVFEPQDGKTITLTIPNLRGEAEAVFTLSRKGPSLRAQRQGPRKPWSLLLRGTSRAASVSGGSAEQQSQGLLITADAGTDLVEIKL